jgi:hypothetical protein
VGTPGGPARYALRRLPVRRELYGAEYAAFRSDPEVDPYDDAQDFTYHEAWTGPVFRPMAFIIRVMCLDTHDELAAAWRALIDAGFPPGAVRVFSGMDGVGLAEARGPISEALRSADRINEVRLAKQLGERFRAQYRETIRLAGEGR